MSNSIVRATCPSCGDVVLTTADLGLIVDDSHAEFRFACPRCRQPVSHGVPAGIVYILEAAGVHHIDPEPEMLDAEVLDAKSWAEFRADFDRADCLDQLRRLGHGAE